MRRYRFIWSMATGVLGLFGAALAVALVSLLTTLVLLCTVAGVTAGMEISLADSGYARFRGRRTLADEAATALIAGLAVVSLVGYGLLLGTGAVPLLVLLAASSPATIRYCIGRIGTTRSASAAVGAAPIAVATARPDPARVDRDGVVPAGPQLSDKELCIAWRRSYPALQQNLSPPQRLRIVEARQSYLDELERRHPQGLARWLTSGARAAGDPSRYLASE